MGLLARGGGFIKERFWGKRNLNTKEVVSDLKKFHRKTSIANQRVQSLCNTKFSELISEEMCGKQIKRATLSYRLKPFDDCRLMNPGYPIDGIDNR